MSKLQKIIGAIIILALGIGVYFYYHQSKPVQLGGVQFNKTGTNKILLGHPNPYVLNQDKSLVGYWSMDAHDVTWTTNKITDLSGNNNTGQLIAMSTTTSPVAGKIGGAMNFNGTSQYVSSSLSLVNTKVITISAWVKLSTTPSGSNDVVADFDSSAAVNWMWAFRISATSQPTIFAGTNYGTDVVAGTAIAVGSWVHFVATYDGTTLRVYQNGVQTNSKVVTPTFPASPGTVSIGRAGQYNGNYFNGSLDDVRIYNRALSATEVNQLYNVSQVRLGASNPKFLNSDNSLVGYWSMDNHDVNWTSNKMTDLSGNSNTGQLIAFSTTTSGVTGRTGSALRFNGTSQYVNVGNFPSLSFERTDTFSIFLWVYRLSDNQIIIGKLPDSGSFTGYQISCEGGKLTAQLINTLTTNQLEAKSTNAIPVGKWASIGFTYDGSSKVSGLKLYINGVLETNTNTIDTLTASIIATEPFRIGSRGSAAAASAASWLGSVDQVRVYKRVLSAMEIKQLWASGQ